MVKLDFDLSDVKIPKTVAGVKVPKKLRKRGKKLLAKAQTPGGREVIATGLALAGAAIAAGVKVSAGNRTRDRAAPPAASPSPAAAEPAAPEPVASDGAERLSAGALPPDPPPAPGAPPAPPPPPRAPGIPGIDPATDPVAELGKLMVSGLGTLQGFLNGRRPG